MRASLVDLHPGRRKDGPAGAQGDVAPAGQGGWRLARLGLDPAARVRRTFSKRSQVAPVPAPVPWAPSRPPFEFTLPPLRHGGWRLSGIFSEAAVRA
ncbi:MAG TPA: hypothetical protein VFH51_07045, partial [Myxococcota bacterium]|nr:hypothetical protein [Myxococcota bacterium]